MPIRQPLEGRRLTASDPDLGLWSYQYDTAGRLTRRTDALNQATSFAYDRRGRMTAKTARFGLPQAVTTAYAYDETRTGAYQGATRNFWNSDEQSTVTSPSGVIRYDHDAAGRRIKETYVVDGATHEVETLYDTGGRVIGRKYPDGDSVGTSAAPWVYDAAGRLLSVPGIVNSMTYNGRGQVLNAAYANGVTSAFTYDDSRGWLKTLLTATGATQHLNLAYTQDPRGRITQVTSAAPNADEGFSYVYDSLDQLVAATNAANSALSQSFTWNNIGNILQQTGSSAGVLTYAYPLASQPRPHAPSQVNGVAMSYDANGNLASGRGRTYQWDGENRPATITNAGVTSTFVYGPDDRRLKKTASTGAGGAGLAALLPPRVLARMLFG